MQNVRDNNAKMEEDAVNQYLQYYFMVKRPQRTLRFEDLAGEDREEVGCEDRVGPALQGAGDGRHDGDGHDPRDVVKVHYTGRTREGKVFDTSKFANRTKEQQEMIKQQRPDDYDKDEPVEFPAEPRHPGLDRGSAARGQEAERSRCGSPPTWLTVRAVQAVTSARTRRWSSRLSDRRDAVRRAGSCRFDGYGRDACRRAREIKGCRSLLSVREEERGEKRHGKPDVSNTSGFLLKGRSPRTAARPCPSP